MATNRVDKRYCPVSTSRWAAASVVCDVLSIIVIIGAVIVIALAAGGPSTTGAVAWVIGAVFVAFSIVITGIVASSVVVFRGWAQIQSHPKAINPWSAVIFSFIPIVNVVWMYFAFGCLAKRINEYMDARDIDGKRAGYGVCLAGCICFTCSILPGIGPFCGVAAFVLILIGLASIANASIAIAENDPLPAGRHPAINRVPEYAPEPALEAARARIDATKPARARARPRRPRRSGPFDEPEKL